MNSITIEHHGAKIKLLDYVPDYYLIAEKTNNALHQLRIGITTWVAADIYTKMQPSIWVYKVNLANIDVLFISTYLSFRIFAEKTGRNFDR